MLHGLRCVCRADGTIKLQNIHIRVSQADEGEIHTITVSPETVIFASDWQPTNSLVGGNGYQVSLPDHLSPISAAFYNAVPADFVLSKAPAYFKKSKYNVILNVVSRDEGKSEFQSRK